MSKKYVKQLLNQLLDQLHEPNSFKDCVKLRRQCIENNKQLKNHATYIKLQLHTLRTLKEQMGRTDDEILDIFTEQWNTALTQIKQAQTVIGVTRQTVERIGTQMAGADNLQLYY